MNILYASVIKHFADGTQVRSGLRPEKRRMDMKRILSVVIVLALMLGMCAGVFAAAPQDAFRDVAEDAWYFADVYSARELGLMEGIGDGLFDPSRPLILCEAVTLAARARSLYMEDGETFERHDEWYRVYADYALDNGILKEEPEDWTAPATRDLCAALFSAAMPEGALEEINTVDDGAIPDVDSSDAAVYRLYRAGIMVGDGEHCFHPADPILRCEIAAVVNRLLKSENRLPVELKKPEPDAVITDPVTPPAEPEGDGEITVPYDVSHPEEFASGEVLYEDGSMLIKFKKPFDGSINGSLSAAGVAKMEFLMDLGDTVWYTAYVTAGTDIHDAVEAVRAMSNVVVAEYNFVYTAEGIVADDGPISEVVLDNAQINDQWYINSVGIQQAWQFERGSLSENFRPHMINENPPEEGTPEEPEPSGEPIPLSGGSSDVVVAVIDTGVDYTHEDLRANMWHNPGEIADNGIDDDGNGYVDDYFGVDIVAGQGSGNDDHGHGTHVAGIIAAVNNDRGIVGVAYNARIMSVKAGQSSGFFNNSAVAAAIIYAANNGADVINMSFGGTAITIAVQDALAYAYTRCVLVAAAGNENNGNEPPFHIYPAALPYVLGVMSVNRYGMLSLFSNYDGKPFNNYEYEVYAPGEAMLSTIPGDRYISWNGTSMAAPIVSGIAALLRSEFTDRNIYPTKFIYGQLSGTGPTGPDDYHGIVNAYNALTILPKPDVEVTDYRLFDTPGFEFDTAGKNSGDGVIDAGETVAIGFFLRNHWGMGKNVTVTVDALSPAGIPCPYLEVLTDSVNYGVVGTYSTQDAGQIMTDGDVFSGWENPIYLHITSDCPNDYVIALNVHVSAENALDPNDDAVYENDPTVYYLKVRRGTILPQIISTDMTLTKESYYIIPYYVMIQPGATLTVEAGTHIQFWTDDPHDAYAEGYTANLLVKGTLLVNGTAEEPVEMFPSDLKVNYCVEIETRGWTELHYANVTNPHIYNHTEDNMFHPYTYADNCVFTDSSTNVFPNQIIGGGVNVTEAKDCVCYKYVLGFDCEKAIGCAFIDSTVASIYADDCLFYGNNLSWDKTVYETNGIMVDGHLVSGFLSLKLDRIISDPETGKQYLVIRNNVSHNAYVDTVKRFAEFIGGYLACPETQHERDFLNSHGISGIIGLVWDPDTGTAVWENGHSFNADDWTIVYQEFEYYGGSNFISVDNYSFYGNELRFRCDGRLNKPNAPDIITSHGEKACIIELPASTYQVEFSEYEFNAALQEFINKGYNTCFWHNAVINRLENDDVSTWMRFFSDESEDVYPVGGNYWGTVNQTLIGLQIVDMRDSPQLALINEGEYLSEAPESVWPFATNAGVLVDGEEAEVIGNEAVTFYVEFNRDMDQSIPLRVCFGSYYPYADYEIEGEWVSARRWEGSTTLTTLIEGGYNFFSISNGASVDGKKLYTDWGRFRFKIDNTAAMALVMQGTADANGVTLTWTQDDFDTLMGYNVYRSTALNGQYTRLNRTVIPADTKTFFDPDVEPGMEYFYNFTVVKTDATESEPSGRISVFTYDTMAPILTHSPVYQAFAGNSVTISANVTDNVGVQNVKLYYRMTGENGWHSAEMSHINDKYTAIITANYVTTAGLEYYIDAFDGISHTLRGSAAEPFVIAVQATVADSAKGDVNNNGRIDMLDALLILQAINGRVNLSAEEFARADINGDGELSAFEAMRILQYINGKISSVLFD